MTNTSSFPSVVLDKFLGNVQQYFLMYRVNDKVKTEGRKHASKKVNKCVSKTTFLLINKNKTKTIDLRAIK